MTPDHIADICQRLALNGDLTRSILSLARMSREAHRLADKDLRPSQITRWLDAARSDSLHALWLGCGADSLARRRIARYMLDWRHCRPTVNGTALKQRGLESGPRYREILDRLRDAWLDGELRSVGDERALLDDLLADERQIATQ